jgi:hypothetical protein
MPRCIRVPGIAVMALALAIVPVSAQRVLGLHAGVSVATLSGTDITNASSRAGLSLGASLTFPVAHVLGIQVGANFVQKGAKESIPGVGTGTFAIDYIEVPVLLRVGIPSGSPFGAHLFIGPSFSFQTKCSVSASSGGVSASADCNSIGTDMKTYDIGTLGGVGLSLGLPGKLDISVDALYNLGLSSIVKNVDAKNRALTIQAGVGFPLG